MKLAWVAASGRDGIAQAWAARLATSHVACHVPRGTGKLISWAKRLPVRRLRRSRQRAGLIRKVGFFIGADYRRSHAGSQAVFPRIRGADRREPDYGVASPRLMTCYLAPEHSTRSARGMVAF